MKKLAKFSGGVIVLLIVWIWVFPWTKVGCHERSIDVNTGRVRTTVYIFGVPVYRAIRNTGVTTELGPEYLRRAPDWQTASVLGPFRNHSPHFAFHGALLDIEAIETLFAHKSMSPDGRSQVAGHIVFLWQRDHHYFHAHLYVLETCGAEIENIDGHSNGSRSRPEIICTL